MSTTHHPHPKPHWLMAARMRLFTVLVYPAFFLWMLIGSPFLLLPARFGLPVSIGLTAAALFGVGATISLFTGRSALRDGLRMLGIGGAAGALTYAIGHLLGVNLG